MNNVHHNKGEKSMAGWIVTDPQHGGKVNCHKCNKWIYMDQDHIQYDWAWFHEECFNPYEHYYGLDKPID
jgi:hypothetical protein